MQTKTLSLYHIVKEPIIKKDKTPVLFMFHGYGSDENDLFSFATELQEELFIISVRAPYPMQPYGNAWYAIYFDAAQGKFSDDKQAIESRDKIANFIDEACNAYPIDKNNVNLLGFSQGCILSFGVALTYPEKIKNVIGLSGYINDELLPEKTPNSNTDYYISHGTVDQVLPVDWARKAPAFLEANNFKNEYSEYPVGHGVAPQNFYSFKSWIDKRL